MRYRDPGTSASAVLAVGVHVMLFAVLFFGIRWRTKQPEPVMAELWRELPAIETPRAAPPPVVAPKPELKPEPAPEPPPPPKVEPKPEPKPDIALEQEKKRKEEAEKKKREEEVQKRKREEEAQKRKREEELKAKAEQERKEKELAAQRRREDEAAERRRVQDQLARELSGAPKSAPRAAAQGVPAGDPSALATWQQQIQAKVKSNIVLPLDLAGNPEAVFDVFLLPTGEVQSVKLVKSSGSGVLDDAWERAILKSSPLPRPAKAEVFRRDLRLVFRPRE
jgi:colicin import membrane protein